LGLARDVKGVCEGPVAGGIKIKAKTTYLENDRIKKIPIPNKKVCKITGDRSAEPKGRSGMPCSSFLWEKKGGFRACKVNNGHA